MSSDKGTQKRMIEAKAAELQMQAALQQQRAQYLTRVGVATDAVVSTMVNGPHDKLCVLLSLLTGFGVQHEGKLEELQDMVAKEWENQSKQWEIHKAKLAPAPLVQAAT